MTLAPGGSAGNPRDAEVLRQNGLERQQRIQAQADARRAAKAARPGWLRRRRKARDSE